MQTKKVSAQKLKSGATGKSDKIGKFKTKVGESTF